MTIEFSEFRKFGDNSSHGDRIQNIAESGDDAGINGVCFCVIAEAFGKVAHLLRIDNGACNLEFFQQFDEQRFVVAISLHDNDRLTGFLEGCDPSTDLLFVVADRFPGRTLEISDIDLVLGDIDLQAAAAPGRPSRCSFLLCRRRCGHGLVKHRRWWEAATQSGRQVSAREQMRSDDCCHRRIQKNPRQNRFNRRSVKRNLNSLRLAMILLFQTYTGMLW